MGHKAEILLGWPDKKLSPNYGDKNRFMKYRLRQEARTKAAEDARWHITEDWVPFTGQGQLTIIFHPPDRRRRDLDNLLSMVKQAIDGICEVLGIDDHQLHPVSIDYGQPDPERPHIEVIIEDLERPDDFFGAKGPAKEIVRQERKQARLNDIDAEILHVVRTGGPLVANEIFRRVGGNRNRVLVAIRRLHEKGKLNMTAGLKNSKIYNVP
jgi:crossover junction endodeoxyribonuclease RusA